MSLPDTTTVQVVQRIPVTLNSNGNDAFLVVNNFEYSLTDVSSPLAFAPFNSPYYVNIYVPMCAFYQYGAIVKVGVKFTPSGQWVGSQQEAYTRFQHVVTPAFAALPAYRDLTQYGNHRQFSISQAFSAAYSPSAKAKQLGVPCVLDGPSLSAPSAAYTFPHAHCFFFAGPKGVAPLTVAPLVGFVEVNTVVQFHGRLEG